MIKQIFVNLPVKDLEATKTFWTAVGFTFNPQFSDQNAASLVLGENIYAMLIVPSYFSTFTKKEIVDATKMTEAINALGAESKAEVDNIVDKAIAAGGKETRAAEDHGWMYGRSFEDLDGHQWEVTYIDVSSIPANPGEAS
ncbi:glyoxalase/bleomycin resistance/extradiol dioxygenase family protein [Patescibacteria group bacterium]|nr:glyoxalase/bleomycin resistance/extradiol dioxygenase family protein [Patescibacteria group bacterium]